MGWRNVFDLPIQYDVELCPGLLSPESTTLSNRFRPEDGPRRRFVVIGERRDIRERGGAVGGETERDKRERGWGGERDAHRSARYAQRCKREREGK